MRLIKSYGRFGACFTAFCLVVLTFPGCHKAEEAAKKNAISEGASPPSRSLAELREDRLRASREELDDLRRKVASLDAGGHFEQSRSLLVDAVERFRLYPEVALPFFEFWLQTDADVFRSLKDFIGSANLDATKRSGDFQSKETWLQNRFDEEFEKHWYGIGPFRGIGYATAEYLWKSDYVKNWADSANSEFSTMREKRIRSTLATYFVLNASTDQWRKSSTSLFSAILTDAQLDNGRKLLARSAAFREKTQEEFREWVSYNVISPRIGQASLLAWKADYCDKEVYQKRNTLKQVFSALESIDLKILRECNDDVKGQYRSVIGEIDSVCKKYPSLQANFQLNIETQFNIIKIF